MVWICKNVLYMYMYTYMYMHVCVCVRMCYLYKCARKHLHAYKVWPYSSQLSTRSNLRKNAYKNVCARKLEPISEQGCRMLACAQDKMTPCMYVCICICMYIRMYVCMYVYMYVCMHVEITPCTSFAGRFATIWQIFSISMSNTFMHARNDCYMWGRHRPIHSKTRILPPN